MNNERVLQFRIGLFVVGAGLVLFLLIVWFGEIPSLLRDHRYLVVHYEQAPGVSEGIPVRKNGIRVGEVTSIQFDERPGQPDGVLVTLSLDSRFRLRSGSVPRLSKGLIGDVWIDLMPGSGQDPLATSQTPEAAMRHIVEGTMTPDPANALAAATEAFQDVKGTLKAIETAANGLANVTSKAEDIDEFLISFRDMGHKVGQLADRADKILGENAEEIGPTISNLRQAITSFNTTLDPKTQAYLRTTAQELAESTMRFNKVLDQIAPLATDLGSAPDRTPTTLFGQLLARAYRVVYDVQLLADSLSDGKGHLNTNGSIQRLLTRPDLYNNLNSLSENANRVMAIAERALSNLDRFAERVANDPSLIGRGALQR
jgi:phospholipid/cholesterol/gamma-HCH transport system substrate-binding protein